MPNLAPVLSDIAPPSAAYVSADLKAIRFTVPLAVLPAFDDLSSAQSCIPIIQTVV
jgi:hypothetical protein